MSALSTWQFILDRLEASRPVILLYVLESSGSSPGRQGFAMAVTSDALSGSIGGGIMEHKFVELAKEKLNTLSKENIVKKQYHNKSSESNQSGMICSGEQTILLLPVSKNHLQVVKKIYDSLSKNNTGLLKLSPGVFEFETVQNIPVNPFYEFKSESEWKYSGVIGPQNKLYIIGGGHCSLAFSRLMSELNFSITLFEERENLNTLEENAFVDEKIIVKDYSELKSKLVEGENVYVVIMTFGYRTDDKALRSIIHKNFKYLGVLGSKSKIEKMRADWMNDNLPPDKLKKIHAPIGISINSQTPEEIAVSIAAEIIAVKNMM